MRCGHCEVGFIRCPECGSENMRVSRTGSRVMLAGQLSCVNAEWVIR